MFIPKGYYGVTAAHLETQYVAKTSENCFGHLILIAYVPQSPRPEQLCSNL